VATSSLASAEVPRCWLSCPSPGHIGTSKAASALLRPALAPPIFFRLALHCGRPRVFDLDPITASAGAVERAELLRHDAFTAERARLLEDDGQSPERHLFAVSFIAIGPRLAPSATVARRSS
jgi:hypothetical protein